MRALWFAAPPLALVLLVLALAPPGEAHAEVQVPHTGHLACATVPLLHTLTNAHVPPNWPLIPSGLGVGDCFRLMFVTNERISLEHIRSLDTLDGFVTEKAERGHSHIRPYADEFMALASCGTTDARDHTSTTFTSNNLGAPIYWLTGAKAADNYQDFWDGSWDSHDVRNQWGQRMNSGGAYDPTTVWTGSWRDGTANHSGICGSSVMIGYPFGSGWELQFHMDSMRSSNRVYGLSDVMLVSNLPSAPGVPTVSSVTDSSVTIEWDAPASQGGTPIFDYKVEIRVAGAPGWSELMQHHWGTSTTHTFHLLFPDTEHDVRVIAYNLCDEVGSGRACHGPPSPVTTFRTHTTAPSAPGTPTVTPSDTSAVVTWTAPAWPGNPPLHDYDMTVRPAPSVPVGALGTGTTHTLTGLEPDTRYEMQVRANNSAGHSPWSPVATFNTQLSVTIPDA